MKPSPSRPALRHLLPFVVALCAAVLVPRVALAANVGVSLGSHLGLAPAIVLGLGVLGMALALNVGVANGPDLAQYPAQMVASPVLPSNPTAAVLTATGNVPARSASLPKVPRFFLFYVTAAAPVTLTFQHPTDATAWVNGDTVKIASSATLGNAVTVQDVTGPTTIGGLTTAAGQQAQTFIYNGATFVYG
jgi:hypothetical protein